MTIAGSRRALFAAGIVAAANPICRARSQGATVTPTTQDLSPTEKMQRVLKALELFGIERPDAKDLPGATDEEIAEAERVIGHHLPATMRQFYGAHNGSQIWGFWPLQQLNQSELPSVVTGTDQYRQWQYPVPQELFLFGDSGSESAYGLWMSGEDQDTEPIVIEMGDCSDEPCLTIVGDDLASFLLGRMAIYFVIDTPYEYDATSVVEVLGVPQELRHFERKVVDQTVDRFGNPIDIIYVDEEAHRQLVRWANPSMPHPAIFGYEYLMTVDEINEFVASREHRDT